MGRAWLERGGSARTACTAAFLLVGGCGTPPGGGALQSKVAAPPVSTSNAGDAVVFAEASASPSPDGASLPELSLFSALCNARDGALERVALRLARRQSEGVTQLDVSELTFALRAEGSPYVWPRAWTLEGSDLSSAAAVERMRAWLSDFDDGGERRCGVALVEAGERSVLSAVAVDVLADLAPLPMRARAGAWLDVSAQLLVPASDAKFVLLGPSGAPHSLPTSFDGGQARARFHADRPGPFLVQLLSTVAGGPRPVLEASVYAAVNPPRAFQSEAAPGEPRGELSSGVDPADALFSMMNAARTSEHSPPLRREPTLDAVAHRHAAAMRSLGRIAHDAGDGDPRTRLEAESIEVLSAGENVAHALTVVRAHRALWGSPSHRQNLLEPRFNGVGLGVVSDADGSVWVCQIFAQLPDERRAPH